MVYVLDTHPLIWHITPSPLLSNAALAALSDPNATVVIPTMCLVEIKYLAAKHRIPITFDQVERHIRGTSNAKVHPLDEQVVSFIPLGLDIHDAVITATAIVYRDILKLPTALITKDNKITQSGVIQTLW